VAGSAIDGVTNSMADRAADAAADRAGDSAAGAATASGDAAAEALHDAARWQQAFDAAAALFAPLADGARMGLIAQGGFAPAGRRRAGLDEAAARCAGAPLLVFAATGQRIAVSVERFAGFDAGGLDLLFAADEEARAELAAASPRSLLSAMKRQIRRGGVLFFVLRTRHELADAGYEDFLESLGIPFLGSCR
jgi:hypothetical protein